MLTLMGGFFLPVWEQFVSASFPSFYELLDPVLRFLLFAVSGMAVTGIVVFVIWPLLVKGVRWIFTPALIGTERRRFHNLLTNVECCSDLAWKLSEYTAATVGKRDLTTSPPLCTLDWEDALKAELRMLYPKLKKLRVPVPDSVEIVTYRNILDIRRYLVQLERWMRKCALDAARKIDPP